MQSKGGRHGTTRTTNKTHTYSRQISVKLTKEVFLAPTLTTWGGFITNFFFCPPTILGFFCRMISNTLSNNYSKEEYKSLLNIKYDNACFIYRTLLHYTVLHTIKLADGKVIIKCTNTEARDRQFDFCRNTKLDSCQYFQLAYIHITLVYTPYILRIKLEHWSAEPSAVLIIVCTVAILSSKY